MMIKTVASFIAGAALFAAGTAAEPKTFNVDRLHTSLYFMVNHLGYANVLGRIQ